ncbi:hypothetical protein ACQEVB_10780 [Pseudonocardia sp. CA-107938]|uniref:hypothetical protein n=1 Tax=Pseudonocardia sp. CA-107938 TaxID=3240021 RepID=UPI003D8CAC49
MKFRRLCKSNDSLSKADGCPAVYLGEDLLTMIVQGKLLDAPTLAGLLELMDDETAVRIATETVIRAVEKLLVERGRPDLATELENVLAELEVAAAAG